MMWERWQFFRSAWVQGALTECPQWAILLVRYLVLMCLHTDIQEYLLKFSVAAERDSLKGQIKNIPSLAHPLCTSLSSQNLCL